MPFEDKGQNHFKNKDYCTYCMDGIATIFFGCVLKMTDDMQLAFFIKNLIQIVFIKKLWENIVLNSYTLI